VDWHSQLQEHLRSLGLPSPAILDELQSAPALDDSESSSSSSEDDEGEEWGFEEERFVEQQRQEVPRRCRARPPKKYLWKHPVLRYTTPVFVGKSLKDLSPGAIVQTTWNRSNNNG